MRIRPVRIVVQQIMLGQQGLILPFPEPAYVLKLLGISDHDDGFRAVEKWQRRSDVALACFIEDNDIENAWLERNPATR